MRGWNGWVDGLCHWKGYSVITSKCQVVGHSSYHQRWNRWRFLDLRWWIPWVVASAGQSSHGLPISFGIASSKLCLSPVRTFRMTKRGSGMSDNAYQRHAIIFRWIYGQVPKKKTKNSTQNDPRYPWDPLLHGLPCLTSFCGQGLCPWWSNRDGDLMGCKYVILWWSEYFSYVSYV